MKKQGLKEAAGLQLSQGASCSSQQPGSSEEEGLALLKAVAASRHALCLLLPGCLTRL